MVPILYLAPIEWNSLWQRPQRIAAGLARRHALQYVEPVGLRNLRLSDVPRIWRRMTQSPADAGPVNIVRPRYVPLTGDITRAVNRPWLDRQLRRRLPPETQPWVLWIGAPSLLAESVLKNSSPDCTIYDCMDHYAAFHRGRDAARIRRAERRILQRSDLVFATSDRLLAMMRQYHPRVELLRNGVDFRHFACEEAPRRPASLGGITGRILGYHGTLGDWLDYAVLETVMRRRADWSLVVAGAVQSRRAGKLLCLPNVHYLGEVPYDELPSLAAHYDVAMIPFVINDLTRCVDPIKVWEYLALGLPVVSSCLPDLWGLKHVVRFATTGESWIRQIEASLSDDARSDGAIRARRDVARRRDWEKVIQKIESRIGASLERGKRQMDSSAQAAVSPGVRRWEVDSAAGANHPHSQAGAGVRIR